VRKSERAAQPARKYCTERHVCWVISSASVTRICTDVDYSTGAKDEYGRARMMAYSSILGENSRETRCDGGSEQRLGVSRDHELGTR
jgi:hypothetical protein